MNAALKKPQSFLPVSEDRLWYNHEWEWVGPDGALLRLLSRMAGTKELPEVCKPNREMRGRESVHVQLEQ